MHALEAILQLHVATDQEAVAHLPFVISNLTQDTLQPSSHLPKWIVRINSLLTSKNTGSRWAGLCLALQTGILNKEILMECSQNWVSICLPILSRNEDTPNMKASIRLLDYIFFQTLSTSEFQRQLATPNVPKYSAALLNLAEKTPSSELQNSCLESLTRLVPAYPTLHRQLQSNISSFCFRLLSGKVTGSDPNIITSTCSLLSILHLTGGKVASTTVWQKTLETSIANAWSAFSSVRLTFPLSEQSKSTQNTQPTFKLPPSDPLIAVPLSLDRLKSASCLVTHLLRAPIYRFTAVTIGELVRLVLALLSCKSQAEETSYDVQRRALEASAVPQLWEVACDLLAQIAISVKHRLNPSLCRILSCIAHNVEQVPDKSHRLIFIRSLRTILTHTYSLHSAVLLNRLVKYLLSRLVIVLPRKTIATSHTQEFNTKGSKKRARGFDGDEVFRMGTSVICADHIDEDILLFSLDALDFLLPNSHLSISLKSLSARLLLNLLFELSRSPAALLSHNPSFHGTLYNKTLTLCRRQLAAGTAGWLNNGIGLIISAIDRSKIAAGDDHVLQTLKESRRDLDMLLHPRLPPPLRSNPPIEVMSFFHNEPETEERISSKTTDMNDDRDVEMMPIAPAITQPEQKDQSRIEQGPVDPPTIQARLKVDLPVSSGVSIPGSAKQTVGIPVADAELPPDTAVNTEADIVPSQRGQQTVNISSTVQAGSLLQKSALTVASSGTSATPQFREHSQRESVLRPPDSDMDDEEIPEINLESDSD